MFVCFVFVEHMVNICFLFCNHTNTLILFCYLLTQMRTISFSASQQISVLYLVSFVVFFCRPSCRNRWKTKKKRKIIHSLKLVKSVISSFIGRKSTGVLSPSVVVIHRSFTLLVTLVCQTYHEDQHCREGRHLFCYMDTEYQSKSCSEKKIFLTKNFLWYWEW